MQSTTKILKKLNPSTIYDLLLFPIFAWCLLIIAAPVMSHLHLRTPSGMTYLFFSRLCHQQTSRSFLLCGKQFAVCARCTGIYFGFAGGALLYPTLKHWVKSRRIVLIMLTIGSLATGIDVAGNYLQLWQNNVWSRASLGSGIGIVLALIVMPGLISIFLKEDKSNGTKTG